MTYFAKFNSDGFREILCMIPNSEESGEWFEVEDSLVAASGTELKDIVRIDGIIRLATEEEMDAKKARFAKKFEMTKLRNQRDLLLADSDKYVGADRWSKYTTTQKGNITAYRQALRDLPLQEGFPEQVVFPELKL